MKCSICNREVIDNKSDLCLYHSECYKKIKSSFEVWRLAYGELDWLNYLQRVDERPETGIWVKECCELLKKKKNYENS